MPKTPETRLSELQKQAAQLNARIQKERGKIRDAERKKDTRRKIIAGALALEHAEQDPEWQATLHKLLSRYVERDEDRALFGLLSRSA
jgi:hypothetical protein